MPEVTKKRAMIAEIIRKLTEEQRVGEVVSWPKISFLPSGSDVLRGSQLWQSWEEEDSKAELPLSSTRAKRTTEVAPKPKPSVVPRLNKGFCPSEWEFPDFEDDVSAPTKSRGRGSRGRLGGGRGGLGRGGRGRGRGGRGIVGNSWGVNIVLSGNVEEVQEGQKAVDCSSRGGRSRGSGNSARVRRGQGNIERHNHEREADDWKFKAATDRSSEQMNDVLLRVTRSREANQGEERKEKLFLKELEVGKHNGVGLSYQASRWV